MFTSFPSSYFEHPASNLLRSPEVLRPMRGDRQVTAPTPGPGMGDTSSEHLHQMAGSHGLCPEQRLKPGISGSEEENRRGRMRLPSPTAPQWAPAPLPACASHVPSGNSHAFPHPAFHNIQWVGVAFLSCI